MRLAAQDTHRMGKLYLPPGNSIELDADLLMLYRADGSRVAAFVAGVAPSEVARMAEVDYRATEEEGKDVASKQKSRQVFLLDQISERVNPSGYT